MIRRYGIGLLLSLVLCAVGCNKSAEQPATHGSDAGAASSSAENSGSAPLSNDAALVRQAIEDHVRNDREINLSAMEMNVDSVNVNGDKAQANVTFRIKQGGAAMAMIYSLKRQSNGWQVLNGQPADGQFTHPPVDQGHAAEGTSPSNGMPDVHEFLKNHPAATSN